MSRLACLFICLFLLPLTARAQIDPKVVQEVYDRVTPSLVVVQYTWDSELGKREVFTPAIVVSADGLVMFSMYAVSLEIPDEQLKDFKVVIPSVEKDHQELEAEFTGRDERTLLAFARIKEKGTYPALKFVDTPVQLGESLMSIGLLPKQGGYKGYVMRSTVAAHLRGAYPYILVSGGLGMVGAPVINAKGEAVGFVNWQQGQSPYLNFLQQPLQAVQLPPTLFQPSRDFAQSFEDPIESGKPQALPWSGMGQITGLTKDVADFFGLKDTPAVEITDVIPGGPADKVGLKKGMKIVKLDGKPIERGDEPDDLPQILQRYLHRKKVGDTVAVTIIEARGKEPREVKVVLEGQPARPNIAKRFWAEDLGFGVRELTFYDTYFRRLPVDQKGVSISLIKPEGAAETAKLAANDIVTELNDTPVATLEDFKKVYESTRASKPGDAMKLVVLRQGATQVIRIEPPQ